MLHVLRKYRNALCIGVVVICCCLCTTLLIRNTQQQEEQVVTYVSGALAKMDLDELLTESSLVVKGTVTDDRKSFQIRSVNGGVSIFTDISFQVSEVIRGETENDTITIRVQGGTVGNTTEIHEHDPIPYDAGQELLVFLYKPGRGGSYNTEGDYYYVLGLTQGVYAVSEEGYVSSTGAQITEKEVYSMARKSSPVDENYFRNEYIENQKRNLENGFITQEEYDTYMENIDVYAKIVG